ncbi:MAG TPA: MlaD family protein [Acetobacteraceae bacterium]
MSDHHSLPDRVPPEAPAAAPPANVKPSRWPGWIWLLPVAAVGVVLYLGIQAWTSRGPTVHVVFTSAAGIKAGNTKVKFKGQEVGDVESVALQKDLKHTDVELSLASQMAGHLGAGTRFWIDGGTLSLNDVSSLKTLVAGPYIGIEPHDGKQIDHFEGLQKKPELTAEPAGRRYLLHEDKLGTLSAGSPVLHLGIDVGEVLKTAMAPDGKGVDIEAFVRAPYDKLVRQGTRFWDAGAVQISSGGNGPRVQFQSLPALVGGAMAFTTPAVAADTPVAAADSHFSLYQGETEAADAPTLSALGYRAVFINPSGTLADGAPVILGGKRIGEVTGSTLVYDGNAGRLELRASLMLEPSLLPMDHVSGSARDQMDGMLRRLIADGLRASLDKSPPVLGGEQVALRFAASQPEAALGEGPDPEIPTTAGTGIDDILAQASSVMAKANAMPLDRIGNDVQQVTHRLADLSASPKVTDALRRVDAAITNVQQVSATMDKDVPQALRQLTQAVHEARDLLGSEGEVGDQPQTSSLPATLYEVRRAARSIRELADMIDRNPQALLTGRGAKP